MATKLSIPIFGNLTDLESALNRAGLVAEDASKKIAGSFRSAGLAAAESVKQIGGSLDEQAAAAGRAAAAFTEMSATISRAQRNAGAAAAAAAGKVGASVDEQRAAYSRAVAAQREYEAATKAAADAQVEASRRAAAAAKAAADEQVAAARRAKSGQESLSKMGGKVLLGGVGLVAGAAYEGVKGMVSLQRAMEQLKTQAGASQFEVNRMTKAVLGLAGPLATSPLQLADSLYHVESAGFRGAQALQIMSTAAKEAKISGADLTDTTTALTASVFSGIKGAQNMTSAMGLLNATVGAGDMKFQDLNEAFAGPMLATVKGYGLSLKDVGAALATFGDLNIRGADAATQLRMAVQYMAKPAATAGPLLQRLGLNVHSFADAMANGGLLPALDLLHEKLLKAGVQGNQMAQVIGDLFTKRGAAGITILENSLTKLQTKYAAVGRGANSFNTDYAATTKTLAFQLDQLKATIQALADKFGAYLIPKLVAVGHATQDVIGWFEKHKAAAETLATVVGGVLGVAVAAYAYSKAVAFVNATKNMADGLGKFAGDIASVVPKIAAKFGLVGTTATATEGEVVAADEGIVASADATAAGVDTALGSTGIGLVLVGLGVAATELMTHWSTVMDAMKSAVNAMAQVAERVLNALISAINTVIDGLNKASSLANTLSFGLVGGGQIGHLGKVGVGPVFGSVPEPGESFAHFVARVQAANPNFTGGAGSVGYKGVPSYVPAKYRQWVATAAAETGLPVSLVASQINDESGFNPHATSSAGAEGIAQFMPGTYAGLGIGGSPYNPADALKAYIKEMGQLLAQYHGNLRNALAAYNAGSGNIGAGYGYADSILAAAGLGRGAVAGTPTAASGAGGLTAKQLDQLLGSGKASRVKSVRELLYANPLPGMTSVGRTDMGVDYTATPGSAVDAIGAGVITKIISNWYKGQPLVEEQLTAGPDKGKFVYYAEQLHQLVQQGQRVRAGQRIGTVAATGTGLELGFGAPGGRTLAQATTGYVEGEQTPAGKAFRKFMQEIGAHGVYQTVKGGVVTGGGPNIGYMIQQLQAAFTAALVKAGSSLITRLDNVIQTGTVRTLSSALGISTGGRVASEIYGRIEHPGRVRTGTRWLNYARWTAEAEGRRPPRGAAIYSALGANFLTAQQNAQEQAIYAKAGVGGKLSIAQINHLITLQGSMFHNIDQVLGGIISKQVSKSPQGKAYEAEVAALIADGQTREAAALVAAHKAAIATLAQEMYAEQVKKDAESLSLQATHLKDQSQLLANYGQNELAVQKSEYTAVNDWATNMLAIQKAQYAQVNNAAQAQVTAVKDMTQVMTDRFSGMVQSMVDGMQLLTDAANATVAGINDQTQTQVDILGERGLYGLSLIAQQQKVALDEQKAADNKAIAAAQANLDALKAQANQAESAAQLQIDQVQLQQDTLVANAQANADAVSTREAILTAAAQANADQAIVVQSQRIATAQAHEDAVTAHEDSTVVGPAQMAVDLGATLPAAQQAVLAANLARAQGQAGVAEGTAQYAYQSTYNNAQSIMATAGQIATNATNAANSAIATAAQAVTAAQNTEAAAIAAAQQNLATVTGNANIAIQQATDTLQGIQNNAAITEAGMAGVQSITSAEASTQFAGSGLVVNMYGIPLDNAAAVTGALDWFARSALASAV